MHFLMLRAIRIASVLYTSALAQNIELFRFCMSRRVSPETNANGKRMITL